jgi:hypothetical protein
MPGFKLCDGVEYPFAALAELAGDMADMTPMLPELPDFFILEDLPFPTVSVFFDYKILIIIIINTMQPI